MKEQYFLVCSAVCVVAMHCYLSLGIGAVVVCF